MGWPLNFRYGMAQIGGGGLRKITTNEPDAALADPLIACGLMKKPTLAVS
jgi:hypothetical protein